MDEVYAAARRLLPALVGVMALGSCYSSEGPAETEPLIDRMIIEIETSDYTATVAQGGFGGVLAIVPLGAFSFKAEFRRTTGLLDPVVNAEDFEVRVASDNSGTPLQGQLTFERTGAFTGTITGMTDGQETMIFFSLWHKSQVHTDFGPYFLRVKRQEGGGGGGGGGA